MCVAKSNVSNRLAKHRLGRMRVKGIAETVIISPVKPITYAHAHSNGSAHGRSGSKRDLQSQRLVGMQEEVIWITTIAES
jgi:hypothetical protein